MTRSKILRDIVREGMDIGYAANKVLDMYNAEQTKQYDEAFHAHKPIKIAQCDELDNKTYEIVSEYLKKVDDIATIGQWRRNETVTPNYDRNHAINVGQRFISLYKM